MKYLLILTLLFSTLIANAQDNYLRVQDGKKRLFAVVVGDNKAISKLEDLFMDAYNAEEVEAHLCYVGELSLAIEEANQALTSQRYNHYNVVSFHASELANTVVLYDGAEEFLLDLKACSL